MAGTRALQVSEGTENDPKWAIFEGQEFIFLSHSCFIVEMHTPARSQSCDFAKGAVCVCLGQHCAVGVRCSSCVLKRFMAGSRGLPL